MAYTPGRGRFQSFAGAAGGANARRGRGRPGFPRSAHQTPFQSYDGHPAWGSPPQGLYPVDERYPAEPDPGQGQLAGGWQTGRTYPDEFVAYPDYADVDESYARSPFEALPRDLRPEPDLSWGRGTADWYGWGGGGGNQLANDGRRLYGDLPNHFTDEGETLQSRIRWRDELLSGDPEKAMADHASETSTLVVSFITRGSPSHPHGQGDELLFFRPRHKEPTRAQVEQERRAPWSFLCIEATPIFPLGSEEKSPPTDDLSKESITKVLPCLDVATDLRLIRRSKPLRWDVSTNIESFLYRLADGKEDVESEAYKELEFRLGHGMHYWTALNGFHGAIESDVVSTAMIAVCLPTALSLGVDNIFSDTKSRSEQLAQQALDVLYLCVQAGWAREAFRFYPIPPPLSSKGELEIVAKRRVWAYWTEVAAWHIARVRPEAQVTIMHSLTKALAVVKGFVDDEKITVTELEKLMVNAIAAEANRAKGATRQLIREGVAEILYNPAFQLNVPSGDKALESMHIVTTSSSSTVYGVLAKLITHVLSKKGSPGPSASSNRRVMDLKITIAESRPLNEGVALAMGLNDVIGSYAKYKEKTSEINRRTSEPHSVNDLGPSVIDQDLQIKLREMLANTGSLSPLGKLKDGMLSPGRSQALGLSHLLAEMEASKTVEEPKVSLEIITDAALVSTIFGSAASGKRPIVLLGADRVLPSGDVINKTGSCQAAWAGKEANGVVLVLTRGDRIHPAVIPAPGKPENAGAELTGCWKGTLGGERVDNFLASGNVSIKNTLYDDTAHEHISAYITDIGLMERQMFLEAVELQSDLLHSVGLV